MSRRRGNAPGSGARSASETISMDADTSEITAADLRNQCDPRNLADIQQFFREARREGRPVPVTWALVIDGGRP